MKKILFLIIGIILVALLVGGYYFYSASENNSNELIKPNSADSNSKITSGQTTYKDYLALEIPSSWYKKESGRNLYISPKGIPSISSLEVYLAFKPQPGYQTGELMSKEEFKSLILKQTTTFKSVSVEEISDITIDNMPGIKMIITAIVPINSPNQKEIPLKWMQIITTDGENTRYDISYSAPQNEYNTYIGEVEQILKTINLV